FFQAEDGIRDFHVTGVQTCALPIFRRLRQRRSLLSGDATVDAVLPPAPGSLLHDPRAGRTPVHVVFAQRMADPVLAQQNAPQIRSEERRVGKEGRATWSP